MWSTKHQAPTVRRGRWGRARRTLNAPTSASRLAVISSSGAAGGAGSPSTGASLVVTGPLTPLS